MKKMLFLLAFSAAVSARAQYYDQRNHMLNHSDRNRSIPVKKENEKVDVVQLTLDKLNNALALDSFQQAVIRQQLTDSQTEQNRILSLDIPDESKREQLVALSEKLNTGINGLLNPEQKEKFAALQKKKKK
jgi:hypothetical protein